jgi:hypothetical protein
MLFLFPQMSFFLSFSSKTSSKTSSHLLTQRVRIYIAIYFLSSSLVPLQFSSSLSQSSQFSFTLADFFFMLICQNASYPVEFDEEINGKSESKLLEKIRSGIFELLLLFSPVLGKKMTRIMAGK